MSSDPSGSGGSTRGPGPGDRPPLAPRWVVVLGAVLLVLGVVAVLVALLGDGEHGPSRHGALADPPAATSAGG